MKTDNSLGEVFNVEPAPRQEVLPARVINVDPNEKKIDSDYDHTRNNLHNLLHNGEEALLHALEVAKSSEHPRAFEVVGNLIKNLADVNEQLMDLHAKRQKMKLPEEKEKGDTTITNNSIFVGSTTELNKMINKMKTGE
jgi:hypothetical protein